MRMWLTETRGQAWHRVARATRTSVGRRNFAQIGRKPLDLSAL